MRDLHIVEKHKAGIYGVEQKGDIVDHDPRLGQKPLPQRKGAILVALGYKRKIAVD